MALAVPEFQLLLAQLAADLGVKVGNLLGHMDRLDQFERLQFITDAYPDLVTPYLSASNDLSATWYEEQPGDPGFVATPADLPAVEKLAASGRWALLQKTPVLAMQGSATRSVFDTSRQTVAVNAERENVRWARHASANACGFCRMLATRGAVYRGNSKAGFKAHDHCHCLAVPDRDGSYRPAPYVEKWERDYVQARKDGADSPAAIANAMDKAEGGRRSTGARSARSAPSTAVRRGGSNGGPPRKPPNKPPTRGASGQAPDPGWIRRSRDHINGLTGRFRESVIGYTGSDHERINGWLRRVNAKPDPWVAARVRDLDAVLAANPLVGTTALTRTVDLDAFGLTRGEDLVKIAGQDRVEDGYLSTTRIFGGGATKNYRNPVRINVVAPRGTPAGAIEDVSKVPGQGEVLLGRGLGYILLDPTYDGELGMWTITMLIQGR